MGRSKPIVAIDGPAGSGKSTVARMLSQKLGFFYLDTGAMYRAVAWKVLRDGVPVHNEPEVSRVARGCRLNVTLKVGSPPLIFINGQDISDEIRTLEVGEAASRISQYAGVREPLAELQKRLVSKGGVVVEGRDAQTVVAPKAQVKVFLTARLEERARRRWKELQGKGSNVSFEEVAAEIAERDRRDADRSLSPLRKAPDAVELDTTDLTPEEVMERIASLVEKYQSESQESEDRV